MAKEPKMTDKREMTAETEVSEDKPKKKGKGPSLRERASALVAKARGGPTLDPKVLKAEADKRLELIVSRLESVDKGVANHPPDMVKWWRSIELPALLNGTWTPALKNKRDKKTNEMFGMLSVAGVPVEGQTASESRLDDMLME